MPDRSTKCGEITSIHVSARRQDETDSVMGSEIFPCHVLLIDQSDEKEPYIINGIYENLIYDVDLKSPRHGLEIENRSQEEQMAV